MKCVILVWTKFLKSKKLVPMVKIGGYPILWHIMYSSAGINDFIICTDSKNKIIEDYYKKRFH